MPDLSRSYEEMRLASKRAGNHYFDDDIIEFWGSKVHDAANKWGLFIESIDDYSRTKKLFMVKFMSNDGYITTVEPAEQAKTYEHFSTYDEAKKFRHKLNIALNDAAKSYREGKVLESLCRVEEEGYQTGVFILSNEDGESFKVNTNNFDRFVCG